MALAQALAKQVAEIDADVIRIDKADITGHPDEAEWAAAAINVVLDAAALAKERGAHMRFGNYGGQSIQKGEWQKVSDYFCPIIKVALIETSKSILWRSSSMISVNCRRTRRRVSSSGRIASQSLRKNASISGDSKNSFPSL